MSKLIVVITGAASGIGQALAEKYLALGYEVCALDCHEEALEKLPSEMKKYKIDVSRKNEFLSLALKIKEEVGAPVVWVNCAGIAKAGAFDELGPEDFERSISVNFFGVLYGMKAAMSVMDENAEGVIVNVASVSGMIPSPYLSSYSAAKHAVVGLTRSVQDEMKLRQLKLRLLLVSPGFVKTPIMEQGPRFQFPQEMDWLRSTPQKVALEIIKAVESADEEVIPTLTGKFFEKAYKHAPGFFRLGGRALFAKNWRELLGMDKINR